MGKIRLALVILAVASFAVGWTLTFNMVDWDVTAKIDSECQPYERKFVCRSDNEVADILHCFELVDVTEDRWIVNVNFGPVNILRDPSDAVYSFSKGVYSR